MARIRSVHPGLFTDEAWVSCSPMARILVIGLWTEADDQGAFEWKPIQLKMRLLPADAADVSALLDEIEANGLIKRFDLGGRMVGAIRNFRRFQRPKTPSNTFDLTDEMRVYVGLPVADAPAFPRNGEMTGDDEPPFLPKAEKYPQMEDGGWKEGEKKQENRNLPVSAKEPAVSKSPKGTRLSAEYQLPEQDRDFAASLGVPAHLSAKEFERFRDFWIAKPGKDGVKLDWSATWRNWIRKFADDRGFAPTAEPGAAPKPAFTSIEPGTAQWTAWYEFKRANGTPTRLMDEARNTGKPFAVPTEYPPTSPSKAA
ncbi:hypothetical protein [Kaistia sp. MMO-174]|uniref:hypothetical protein n=1 Tax=Kaistia sp. MMO-174 TaxID=3081256 RepID=UPI00301B49E7